MSALAPLAESPPIAPQATVGGSPLHTDRAQLRKRSLFSIGS
jgi:hypothetical protein